jgi:prepilin-type N-terminal cleavage/methylation domain-containing protein
MTSFSKKVTSPLQEKRNGFTLVELAVVLVIVGLLIGGVLVAQSMIHTSKLQKAVRLLAQCDTVISNFREKYQQLPGDSSYFIPAGDNNGLVEYSESWDAWVQLSQAEKFKNSAGTDYQPIADPARLVRSSLNYPDFDLPKPGGLVAPRAMILNYNPIFNPNPYYWISTGDFGATDAARAFRSLDALAIDKKIDDGNGYSGRVLAGGYAWGFCLDNHGWGTYLANNNFECALTINLGAASGAGDN